MRTDICTQAQPFQRGKIILDLESLRAKQNLSDGILQWLGRLNEISKEIN